MCGWPTCKLTIRTTNSGCRRWWWNHSSIKDLSRTKFTGISAELSPQPLTGKAFAAKQKEDAAEGRMAQEILTVSHRRASPKKMYVYYPTMPMSSSHIDKKWSGLSQTENSQGGLSREEEEGKGSTPVTKAEECREGAKRVHGHPVVKYRTWSWHEKLNGCPSEILQEKLKDHHNNLGTLACEDALVERKRVCVELGLLRKEDLHMVKTLSKWKWKWNGLYFYLFLKIRLTLKICFSV